MSEDVPNVFIGSSSESLDLAEIVQEHLSRTAHCKAWPQGVFEPSGYTLESILRVADTVDFAVFVFAADDLTIMRGKSLKATRDNVILEFGIFLGRLGRERTFVLFPSQRDQRRPSDLDGFTVVTYDTEHAQRDPVAALGVPCSKLRRRFQELGPIARPAERRAQGEPDRSADLALSTLGLDRIYRSYVEAEHDVLNEIANCTGPIRLLVQVGNRDFTARGAIAEALRETQRQRAVEVRILHAGVDSPLFKHDRLESLGKDADAIRSSLEQVNEALDHLERNPKMSVRHRTHELPFFWRVYGFDTHLYLMPYVSSRNAHQRDPVLRFRRVDRSMYHTFTAWFDYTWDRYQPAKVRVDDYVTRATPAGAALFLKWEGRHVFAIPQRDLTSGQHRVRFYGIGGRRESADEDLAACALREGNEETGGAIEQIVSSKHTDFWRANGTIKQVLLVGEELRPRLIMQKAEHTGRGFMAKEQDHYCVVAYDAVLSREPTPCGEVPALLFLTDGQLRRVMHTDVTLEELSATGAKIVLRDDAVDIPPSTVLVPHGTASYVCRELSRARKRS